MQLDKTHVVVRVRTLSEIGDLAMVMIRRYPSALLIGFLVGAVPWIIANAALLSWIPIREAQYGLGDDEAAQEVFRYASWMLLLIVLQTPIAGIFTTIYLGQAVFEKRPTWSSVFQEGRRQFWRWFWVLGIKRLVLPTMALLAFRYGTYFDPFADVVLPVTIVIVVVLVRASRPFVPEILLLEQCPIRSKDSRVITASRRSKSLHSPMNSELSGRFIAVSFISCWLFASVLWSLVWVRGIVTGQWNWGLFVLLVLLPASAWIIGALCTLIRLLNYLDTRIRLEGWEVELAVRAEAIRQFGDDAGSLKPRTTESRQTKPLSTKSRPNKSRSKPATSNSGPNPNPAANPTSAPQENPRPSVHGAGK
ncbi:hypothetical protein [Planctomycetes bacterium K23_9]|uniref:Glycerophosphoryl diester phosphodiesterase membrane domain-containing protein n=1 Tax=Stieleria marina TaxID=1930275 RepID=A0A517NSX9_9BACT|nr:hypothetical protein K239x_21750 [Planctomycetes bacterium K23_9]